MPATRSAAKVREALVYAPDSPDSFFRDLALLWLRRDPDAKARLSRHGRQMTVERAERDRLAHTEFGAVMQHLEARANPSSTLGSGGEFDVPMYLLDKFATATRAGRPLADLVGSTPLPPGISSIHIPRMTTGSLTTTPADNVAVASQDLATVDVVAPVVTVAGQLDVSQQLFDLSPTGFDTYAFTDLTRAYDRNLEAQLLLGTGTSGQMLGALNVPGINTISGATATTLAGLWPLLGQASAAVGNTRALPPEVWLLAIRRWFWIASSLDSSNRPISTPGNGAPQPTQLDLAGGAAPVGPLLGLPAYLDGALPAGTSPDAAVCLRPSDMFLFEGAPRVIVTPSSLAGTLQVRLRLHRYVAWVPHRYPTGTGVVTSIPAPNGY